MKIGLKSAGVLLFCLLDGGIKKSRLKKKNLHFGGDTITLQYPSESSLPI